MNDLENLLQYVQGPEFAADLARSLEKAYKEVNAKYKPLDDWEKTHKGKPKNLYEAVMWRESHKAAWEKVFGPGSY